MFWPAWDACFSASADSSSSFIFWMMSSDIFHLFEDAFEHGRCFLGLFRSNLMKMEQFGNGDLFLANVARLLGFGIEQHRVAGLADPLEQPSAVGARPYISAHFLAIEANERQPHVAGRIP